MRTQDFGALVSLFEETSQPKAAFLGYFDSYTQIAFANCQTGEYGSLVIGHLNDGTSRTIFPCKRGFGGAETRLLIGRLIFLFWVYTHKNTVIIIIATLRWTVIS